MNRSRLWVAFGAALGMGLAAASASALTIGGGAGTQVDPVYFNSGGKFGLLPGPSADFVATSAGDWLKVGSGQPLSVQINLQIPVLQNPQSPASSTNPTGLQGTPSKTNPFVADSLWTITNKTETALTNAYLVFEAVSLAPTTLLPGGYPDVPVGIDNNLFSIIQYTYSPSPGTKASLLFGALSLGSLGAGDSTQIRVRYIVAGALPQNGANLVMPPFTVAALNNAVPEPSTLLLLGSGLALFAAAGRRRCA